MSDWTFITNHGLVLFSIVEGQSISGLGKTAREIGDEVGVTERTAHKIILDLEKDGYIIKSKVGNRNAYEVCPEVPLKVADAEVGALLELLGWKKRKRTKVSATLKNAR